MGAPPVATRAVAKCAAPETAHFEPVVGPVSGRLEEFAPPARALARDKREMAAQDAEIESSNRERIHDACESRAQERDDCLDGKRKPFVGGCMEFCMQRSGITARDCR